MLLVGFYFGEMEVNVLVFKVSKEVQMVPDERTSIEFYSHTAEQGPFVNIGTDESKSVMFDKHVWPIRKFSRYECEPSDVGMPRELQRGHRIDTYIAIDPELENFLSIEHKEKINRMAEKLLLAENRLLRRENEIISWLQKPWYKRAWSAMRGVFTK